MENLCSQVPGVPCKLWPWCILQCQSLGCPCWLHVRAKHPWVLPVLEWDHWLVLQSTQLLFFAMVGPQNFTVLSSRRKYFRGNFYFINFMYILKLILTTFVLLLASCLCCLDLVSIKFSEILITKQVQFTILTTTTKFLVTKCGILALYLILCPCLAWS